MSDYDAVPQNLERADAGAAGRDSAEEVRRKSVLVRNAPLIQRLIDAMPGGVIILNAKRQIIAANQPFLAMIHATLDSVLGFRLGEILGCSFSREGPDGCGTSNGCKNCGLLQAFEQCQAIQEPVLADYNLIVERPIKGLSLELRVKSTSTTIDGEPFIVCALEEIGSRQRLADLSKIFFHDVLNMVGGIQGHLELLANQFASDQVREDLQRVSWLSDQLADEIQSQRDLILAEAGDLEVRTQVVRVGPLLNDLCRVYTWHAVGDGRTIQFANVWDGTIVTDVRLLVRVLGNMLRNALEATEPGGTVQIGCTVDRDQVAFLVHNAAVIPDSLQRELFKRPISTKGRCGRGIGTRSMKLLGEHYLGGAVSFASTVIEGTTFTLRIPKVLCLS